MDFYNIIIIPMVFGLIGFFEPCSLEINIVFLHRTGSYKRGKRLKEAILFTLVRGFVLAGMGLSAAFIGSRFIKVQSSIFVAMGAVFVVAGVFNLVNYFKPIFGRINFSRYFAKRGSASLGLIFGLIIPPVQSQIVLALIGRSVVTGVVVEGFL